jgi:hypothetical protein
VVFPGLLSARLATTLTLVTSRSNFADLLRPPSCVGYSSGICASFARSWKPATSRIVENQKSKRRDPRQ